MNYIDLFHGIGGFALGAYWAGMKVEKHFSSDIDPYCIRLYKKRFPESIQLGDIRKIDTMELKQYGKEWVITAGFPCQDISIAGKGDGIEGSRSGLWFEAWRIIRDLRPAFAIIENVSALSFSGLDRILGTLAEVGYDAEWQNISAAEMGAPHKRERIWVVAYPGCNGLQSVQMQSSGRKNVKTDEAESFFVPDWARGLGAFRDFQGMDDGLPNRVERLAGLGNSIVPQIACILFRRILNLC
jgi:DNA (cytosine-5)-methyltransferase 1